MAIEAVEAADGKRGLALRRLHLVPLMAIDAVEAHPILGIMIFKFKVGPRPPRTRAPLRTPAHPGRQTFSTTARQRRTQPPELGFPAVAMPLGVLCKALRRRGQHETFGVQGVHAAEIAFFQDIRYESFGLPWDGCLTWVAAASMLPGLTCGRCRSCLNLPLAAAAAPA